MIPYVLLGMSRDRAVVFTEINYENPFTNDAAADDVATTATAAIYVFDGDFLATSVMVTAARR